ncbi:BadF/BadG/BcrA/BcrD ATPase family protein [Rugosimonospora africana]|uniref:BadF/BadG/BcrA/BcrD ATPase family protein n=1 Tax=Rugosimonospora africana TaxID=556532 RepID=UPI00194521E4|nr:BadF/BadG/BcrA/BcrD ATPase family protein [Rugosimonospora africana]
MYLGVDAGNSKTVALASLASGEIVGAGRAGCGDIYGVRDPADAVAAVLGSVDAALSQAGATRWTVSAAAFRLAGVDWPEDGEYWDRALREHWPALTQRSIANDGYAALRCGEPSGIGVSVVAGTAAAIAGRGPDGAMWDMGWWSQHAMGALGLMTEALRAVYLAELEAGPPTRLTSALLEFYGVPSVAELNHRFNRREGRPTQADRTRGARVVTATAMAGDPVASDIVDEQGRRLSLYAQIAARKVGLLDRPEPISVVLSGSVLMAPSSPVAAALLAHLGERLPTAVASPATLPPVAGATLDALAEGGVALSPDVVGRLAGTVPPPEFLKT